MKRILAAFLMAVFCLSLAACGTRGQTESSGSAGQDTGIAGTSAEKSEKTEDREVNETAAVPTESSEETDNEQTEEHARSGGILVVYFSATGTTKGVAEIIASVTGGDLAEITPSEPYTSEDLNYNDSNTRATREQHDKTVRPEISGSIENWDSYSVVFLGHPIWWGEEPRIMDTFVESYDFTGKTVIPFCTSGSSGVGSSADNLKANAGTGNWMDGTRFDGKISEAEIREWVQGFDLNIQEDEMTESSTLKENQIRITVGENSFVVRLEDNESAAALRELLADGDRTISASNYGGFEKVCQLGTTLPGKDVQTTTSAGDVMLYSSNQIVIFYDSNSWAYTRLGKVENLSADELESILSGPETEITLSIH